MLVWKFVQVNLEKKYRKLAIMIQGKNAQPSTSIKRAHLTATHEKETQPMCINISSIQVNTLSVNQTQARGSMGPLEQLNRLKTG